MISPQDSGSPTVAGCTLCGQLLPAGAVGGICPGGCVVEPAREPKEEGPPPEIEGYRCERLLGRGGMGAVWLAEQLATRQRVAVKLCARAGGRSREESGALQRFQREIKLAARLQHPHIARVFGGGETGGQPYCVMEYVDGLNLEEHVAAHALGRPAVAALLQRVCEAVQHAHQHGIIHRDLKPSNILVTAQGEPKVVDFGLAKALEEDGELAVQLTNPGQHLGTPLYMSPEQARGELLDTRTDVYSLGVILFRLLTGQHPHGSAGSADAIIHRIATQEGTRPRTACSGLDGELEMLLLKALARRQDERYRTAGDLADDLHRWQHDQPLAAGKATAWYFGRKWLRRHRKGVLALVAALAAGAWIYERTQQTEAAKVRVAKLSVERDRYRRMARALAAQYVQGGDARQEPGAEDRIERALHAVAAEQGLSVPELRTQLQLFSAEVRADPQASAMDRALAAFAEQHFAEAMERATEAAQQFQAQHTAAAAQSAHAATRAAEARVQERAAWGIAGQAGYAAGHFQMAIGHFARALSLADAQTEPLVWCDLADGLGIALTGQALYPAAEELIARIVELRTQNQGPEARSTLRSRGQLATLRTLRGFPQEALTLYRDVIGRQRASLGEDDADVLSSRLGQADAMMTAGNLVGAGGQYRELRTQVREKLGPHHPDVFRAWMGLADSLLAQGQPLAAGGEYRATAELQTSLLGSEHPSTLRALAGIPEALSAHGLPGPAGAGYRSLFAVQERVLGPDHPTALRSQLRIIELLMEQKMDDEIEGEYVALHPRQVRVLGPAHPSTLRAMRLTAVARARLGQQEKAFVLMQQAVDLAREHLSPADAERRAGETGLAELLKVQLP